MMLNGEFKVIQFTLNSLFKGQPDCFVRRLCAPNASKRLNVMVHEAGAADQRGEGQQAGVESEQDQG